MHACTTRSISTYSRKMSVIAQTKMTADPKMLPKIISALRQNGIVTSKPITAAAVSCHVIHDQFNPCTASSPRSS